MKRNVTLARRIVVAGVFSGFLFAATGSQADPAQGLCNAIIAQALGAGLQVANSGPNVEQCTEVGQALSAFVADAQCVTLLSNNELLGLIQAGTLPNGTISPLGSKVCTGIQECGLIPALHSVLPNFCPGF